MCGGDEPPKHPAARAIEEVIDARVGSPQGAFGFRFPAPRLDCLTNDAREETARSATVVVVVRGDQRVGLNRENWLPNAHCRWRSWRYDRARDVSSWHA